MIEPDSFQPSLVSGNTEAGIVFADTSFHNVVIGCIIGMDRTDQIPDMIKYGDKMGYMILNDRLDRAQKISPSRPQVQRLGSAARDETKQ